MKCSKQLVFMGLGMHKYALPTPSKMATKIQKKFNTKGKKCEKFLEIKRILVSNIFFDNRSHE